MLITLPSHMLTVKPPYTILKKLYIVFNVMSRVFFVFLIIPRCRVTTLLSTASCGAQPPVTILTRYLREGGDSNVRVCVHAHVCSFSICV